MSPCPGCPLFGPIPPKATAVLKGDDTGLLRIVDVRQQKKVARVRLCSVTDPLLTELVREKVRRLTQRARLSIQERKTLDRLLRGQHNEEIATGLGISARTVKFHMTNLRRKLGVQSRTAIYGFILLSAQSAPSSRPPSERAGRPGNERRCRPKNLHRTAFDALNPHVAILDASGGAAARRDRPNRGVP